MDRLGVQRDSDEEGVGWDSVMNSGFWIFLTAVPVLTVSGASGGWEIMVKELALSRLQLKQ